MSPIYLRSLLLTGTFSFAAPVLLIGLIVIGSLCLEQVPLLAPIGKLSVENVLKFLTVFGNGSAVEGTLIIGLASSIVGSLFDLFATYRSQKFKGG
jgi:hypothetical protein